MAIRSRVDCPHPKNKYFSFPHGEVYYSYVTVYNANKTKETISFRVVYV